MAKVCLFLLWLFPFFLGNPIKKEQITGTKRAWSGGVCCRTGIDYQLNISLEAKKAKKLHFDSVCIDGFKFTRLRIDSSQTNEKLTIFNIRFSYEKEEQVINYSENNGLSPVKTFDSCSERKIYFTYKGKKFTKTIDELKELESLNYP